MSGTDGRRSDERPLRLALVSPAWPREAFSNGIVSYVASLQPELEALGHSVRVLAAKLAEGHHEDGVIDLRARGDAEPAARRLLDRLRKRIKGDDPQLVRAARGIARTLDAAGPDGAFDLLEIEESFGVARWIRPRRPVPIVTRLHGPWAVNGRIYGVPVDAAFHRRAEDERRAALSARGVTAPSQAILDLTREAWQAPLPHARVIFNPAPSVPPGKRWRAAEARPERLLFVGRFDRIKGADTLLLAFDRLAARRRDLELVFAGPEEVLVDDAGRPWELDAFLAAQLTTPGVAARIRRLGFQPPDEIEALRRSAAVTIVTSRFETSCNALSEAMAFGCPAVASRVGGIPEMMQDGLTGRLFEAGDVDGLVRAVEAMLDDPEAAAALGARAAEHAARVLGAPGLAAETVDYYREVLASGR